MTDEELENYQGCIFANAEAMQAVSRRVRAYVKANRKELKAELDAIAVEYGLVKGGRRKHTGGRRRG